MGFEERGTSDQQELLGVGIDIKEGDNELKLDQTLEVGGARGYKQDLVSIGNEVPKLVEEGGPERQDVACAMEDVRGERCS